MPASKLPEAREIQAYVALDCAAKQRVRYTLPRNVAQDFLEGFPRSQVNINEFSKITAGAKDHFSVRVSGEFAAGGVLGERSVTVTYGKVGSTEGHAWARAAFEAKLLDYCACELRVLGSQMSRPSVRVAAGH